MCSFYDFVKLCHETQLWGPFLQHLPHEGTSSQNSVLHNVLVLGGYDTNMVWYHHFGGTHSLPYGENETV